ncbi:MAG: hypothetical protein R3D33_16140 [Hyphomicrobiaceae bacterium]
MSMLKRIAAAMTEVVTPVYVLRAPLIATGIASALLAGPDQTLEIYRSYALDRLALWPQIVMAAASLTLAGVLIWFVSRNLTLMWQQVGLTERSLSGVLLRWMPRLLGAAPLFAAAYGLSRAARGLRPIEIPPWVEAQMPTTVETIRAAAAEYQNASELLWQGVAIFAGIGILIVLLTFLRSWRKHWKFEQPNPYLFSIYVRGLFYLLTIGLVVLFSSYFLGAPGTYRTLATELGTFTIVNLFLICVVFFLSALTNIYDSTRFPAISLLVLLGLGASAFDLNDNHRIRTLKEAFIPLPSATKAFRDWYESRPDRAYFASRGEPYPVYIVAAEGGGLYAAQHAALTLARLQDRCPGFAQHVFAISGVSGGSLGAAIFSSLARARAEPVAEPACAFGEQPPGWYELRTNQFLGRDFLSPLAAATLFPDFMQRFVPWPFQAFSRANALENAFEEAWDTTVMESGGNPFAESYYQHWQSKGIAPALVLNATHVETGSRVLIAPFRFYKESTVRLPVLNSIIRADLRLSTAVGISARYPWLLPAATWRRGREEYRFVDGGYFESSGIDTSLDLVNILEDELKSLSEAGLPGYNVKINLVILSPDDILEDPSMTPYADVLRAERTSPSGFDEAMSPLTTLLNAQWQRGVVSVARAYDKFCADCIRDRDDRRTYGGIDGDARVFRLNFTDFHLTLGWHLSAITQALISAHSGYPDRCLAAKPELRKRWPWTARVLNENNCSSCQMMYTLSARAKELQSIAPSTRSLGASADSSLPSWVMLCRAEAATPAVPMYRLPGDPQNRR